MWMKKEIGKRGLEERMKEWVYGEADFNCCYDGRMVRRMQN